MTDLNKMHEVVSKWIREAGDHIMDELDHDLAVKEKTSPNDLVTNLDYETEKIITEKIRDQFPDHRIVSEEGFGDDVKDLKGPVWFIDPIDGTLNFVKQKENFCIMLAYFEDGVGQLAYIYNVMRNEFYHIIKDQGVYCNDQKIESIDGVDVNDGLLALNSKLMTSQQPQPITNLIDMTLGLRLYGSAGIESMEVLRSRTVAYIAAKLQPWDFAPAYVFITELGGKLTNFEGNQPNLLEESEIVVANPVAHATIIDQLNQ